MKRLAIPIIKDSILYGATSILSKLMSFITLPIYIKYLSKEEFGLLDFFLTVSTFLFIIVETQLISAFMRFFYEKKINLSKLVGNVLLYYYVSNLLLIFILCFIYIYNNTQPYFQGNYVLPIVLYLLPKQISDIYILKLRLNQKRKKYFFYFISKLLITSILSAIMAYLNYNIRGILWSISIVNIVYGFISYNKLKNSIGIDYTLQYLYTLLLYSLPIFLVVLGNLFLSSVSKIYIIKYFSFGKLAVYSIVLKIGIIFLLFSQTFKIVCEPYILKQFSLNKKIDVLKFSFYAYLFLGLIALGILSFLTKNFIFIFITTEYKDIMTLLPLVLVLYYLKGSIDIISIGNTLTKKTYLYTTTVFVNLFSTTILIDILIQKYQLTGIFLSELFGTGISFCTAYYFNKNINYNILIVMLCVLLSLTIVFIIF